MASARSKQLGKVALAVIGVVAAIGLAVGARHVLPGATAEQPEAAAERRIPVTLTPARRMPFADRLVISGCVQAKNYALVSARIPGTLDAVFVDEGDSVQAGETKLFQTDSVKLTKALAVARQELVVAESALLEKQARLERELADKEQVEKDVERYRQLASQKAIPAQQFEQHESKLRQCVATIKDVEALIALSEAQVEQARLSLAIAEKDLDDSLVLAPISGRVSERRKEPGEMAAAGAPVLKIEDLSVVEISVFLPEQSFAQVIPGQTMMRIRVGASDLGDHPVSYKSPTVQPRLRTFEVRAVLQSPPDGVVPGRLAEVQVVLESRESLGVPAAAVLQRDNRSVVFLVEQSHAQPVPVETGLETDGWIEIRGAPFAPTTPVITMGQDLVDDGAAVTVVQEESTP